MKDMTVFLNKVNFFVIKQSCVSYITSPGMLQYPSKGKFVCSVEKSSNMDNLFSILNCFGYLNLFYTQLLRVMVDASDNKGAVQALEEYDGHMSKIKLNEIFDVYHAAHPYCIAEKIYDTVTMKFYNNIELTIRDIQNLQDWLQQFAGTADITIPKIKTGCNVKILWSIPREYIAQLYNSSLTKYYQFDALMYLKCATYPTILSLQYARSKDIFTGN